MLEGILDLGKEPRLIEELGGLQVRQTTMYSLLRHLGNGP
jgi:hypothetical protein